MKVENINFSLPAELEYRRQKSKVSDRNCRHLKPLKRITILDKALDETIDIMTCSMCHKELDDSDLEKRKQTLLKFKNI